MEKNNKQRKLIGKIILADLLEYRLEKFIAFIREVEELPLYKKLIREGVIIRKPLSGAKILKDDSSLSYGVGVIAKIKRGSNFSIHYTYEEFSIEYVVDAMKLGGIINDVKLTEEEKKNVYQFLHKLRRISTRNLITHEILKGIVEYQGDYLESNSETENELDLKQKPLRRIDLAKTFSKSNYNTDSHSFVIDTSRISRVTEEISIITPHGNEVSLKALFPTKRDIVKSCIKVILNKEKREIRDGSVKKPYTDEELRRKLIMEKSCVFRYLQVHKGWVREEKSFYNLFVTTFGAPPVCNHVSPKGEER